MSQLLQALRLNARERSKDTAISDGREVISWHSLLRQVEELADQLTGATCLAILLDNSPAWVVADLAALEKGVACVPVPPFFSADQVKHSLIDAGVDTVITGNPERVRDLVPVIHEDQIEVGRQTLARLRIAKAGKRCPGDIAKITYTSGTTGNPKGVPLTLNKLEAVAAALCAAGQGNAVDRALAILPLSTLLENIGAVYVPLLAGATMLLPSPQSLGWQGSSKLDAGRMSAVLRELAPTSAILTPELLKLFVGLAAAKLLPESFRFIAVGGAPVATSLLEQAEQLGLPVFQGYGLSEAGSVVSMNVPGSNKHGSAGKVLDRYQLGVRPDGEILVGGTAFAGYLHSPRTEPADWISTGDLGYVDSEGFLYITGRKREVIINSFGRNVSPEWVESEVLGEQAVAQIAVFGNDRLYLTAVITPAETASAQDLAAALARVNRRLPDYARIQAYVTGQGFDPGRGELTANGRPRRDVIYRNYQAGLEQLYEVAHEQIL